MFPDTHYLDRPNKGSLSPILATSKKNQRKAGARFRFTIIDEAGYGPINTLLDELHGAIGENELVGDKPKFIKDWWKNAIDSSDEQKLFDECLKIRR